MHTEKFLNVLGHNEIPIVYSLSDKPFWGRW